MAYTFPSYTDITGAQIIATVTPRTSLGAFDADAINLDKTNNTVNSVIGLAVQSFNDWFTQINVTINDVSDDDGAKITKALELYIAGRYLEDDKLLTSSDSDVYPYQDVKHLYDRACILIKETEANISGVADFCSYGKDKIGETWEAEGFTKKCKPKDGNFSRGMPTPKQKAEHSDLEGLLVDDHPQYLTETRGNARYYTKAEVDSKIPTVITDHGALSGLLDDDHTQYYNQSRGDARYSQLGHDHDSSYAAIIHTHDYTTLTNLPTLFDGDYDSLTNKPDLSIYVESVTAGTNITIGGTAQNPIINSTGGGIPGGSDTEIQFNDGGAFGGHSGLIYNKTTGRLTVTATGGGINAGTENLISYDSDDNLKIGEEAGDNIGIDADSGIFIGNDAGKNVNSTGWVCIGGKAGEGTGTTVPTGSGNFCLGANAGRKLTTGSGNILIGADSGLELETGLECIYIGEDSGIYASNSVSVVGIGRRAGRYAEDAQGSIFIGESAGRGASDKKTTGYDNVFIGASSGREAGNTYRSVFIGGSAGREAEGSHLSVFIGYEAGHDETTSERLYIANSDTSDPLIYGEFDNGFVKINGELETTEHLTIAEITTPTAVADKGKIYTKTDNKLYFQDGTGIEHEIQFV